MGVYLRCPMCGCLESFSGCVMFHTPCGCTRDNLKSFSICPMTTGRDKPWICAKHRRACGGNPNRLHEHVCFSCEADKRAAKEADAMEAEAVQIEEEISRLGPEFLPGGIVRTVLAARVTELRGLARNRRPR